MTIVADRVATNASSLGSRVYSLLLVVMIIFNINRICNLVVVFKNIWS